MFRSCLTLLVAGFAALQHLLPTAHADTLRVVDVAGREVSVAAPVRRVILGEGRQTYLIAALDTADPFERVVGWRNDLSQADPESYAAYLERFPQIAAIPTFGGFKDGTFDVEQAAALRPDVMLMNLESKPANEDAKYIEKLAALGIPVVYVDFREHPFANTDPSMRLIGKLFGEEARAEAFIAFREREIRRVTDIVEAERPARPRVFVERAGGYADDCCLSFGDDNFGRFVAMAGGVNIAAEIIPGTFGTVNPSPRSARCGTGRDGQVHAIWHQFYNSLYQFVAIQQIAKWLHPELFPDLDPEATLRTLHERFLPIAYEPGYWVSLADGS